MGAQNLYHALDALYGRMMYGPLHRFAFSTGKGVSGAAVEKLMRQYGIRIWGREHYRDHERAFLVKCSQAVWAEYVLCRAGVPLTTPLLDSRNAEYGHLHEPADMPKPWESAGIGAHSFIDHIVDLLGGM